MNFSTKLDRLHARAISNKWMLYFTRFCRIALAAGFIPSGMVKILGERFTALANNHPMGHYLEALFHTGFYYPFIGVVQVTAAICLLIPRMATIGAIIYFPIILNICILSLAVRFDGSLLSSPFMVLANLYLLCWDYDKFRLIFPFNRQRLAAPVVRSAKFPYRFAALVIAILAAVVMIIPNMYQLMPRNTLSACQTNCARDKNQKACNIFCDCIHNKGMPLDRSIAEYDKVVRNGKR